MPMIGYHASHEQWAPSVLLRAVQRAEQAGFQAAMCSDHSAPWSERQGHSGHAWAWLGAALATTSLPLGVVTAPGQRHHPAMTAQAIATLAEMFPGRFWAALGSGENMNEHITGDPWPPKADRNARLVESAEVIRSLLAGDEVTRQGHVRVDRARVWSLPVVAPQLFVAAVSAATSSAMAGWADGLVTLDCPHTADTISAFRDAGGDGKPVFIQSHVAWADDEDAAVDVAFDQWRNGLVPSDQAWDLAMPDDFDRATATATRDDIRSCVKVSADFGRHVAWLDELAALEPTGIFVHHVGHDQHRFIDVFGEHVVGRFGA